MGLFAYSIAILLLQSVILPRLNLFGVVPDVTLASIVAFAVLKDRTASTLFAASLGLAQDIFSAGIYFNLILKVIFCNLAATIKEEYAEDAFMLTAGLVAAFSLVYTLGEGLILFYFFQKQLGLFYFLYKLFAATALNLLAAALVFPVVEKLTHAD